MSAPAPAPTTAAPVVELTVTPATPSAEPTPAATAPTASATEPAPEPAPVPVPVPTTEEVKEAGPALEPATPVAPAEKVVEEPQSALTQKFTEAEWTALKEFRAQLPDIFAAAHPDDAAAKTTAIELWGIPIDPANPAKDARTSVVLLKFLRARNLNVSSAKDMLIATLRWRAEFKIDELMHETFDPAIFNGLAHITGKDRGGRPVTYNVYGANKDLKAVFGDVQRFVRWRVQFMEKSIRELDFLTVDQMIQVHDYEGVSMSSRDANSKNAASECTSIFQAHYPEFLHRKLFVNVPTAMTWIFWLFKSFLSAATVAKMSVVGSGPHTIGKAMLPLVEADELPTKYGGTLASTH